MQQHTPKKSSYVFLTGIIFIVLGGSVVYGYIQISSLKKDILFLNSELSSTSHALMQNTKLLSENITDLHTQTTGISDVLNNTQQNIESVKNQVGGVAQTVGSISGTVGDLQKLSQIDPELLKKYSKVYFLNENYKPLDLSTIPPEYTYSSTRQEYFSTKSLPYLLHLFTSAKADGVTLYVKSGYRSFDEQKSLKSAYTVKYGAGTSNTFSADQGYSEHQLGVTLDFITTGLNGQLTTAFDKTDAYTWLLNNAYRFGFVLSYPKGNKYYVYEPWHWRFVGIELATYLHKNTLNFYDIDQREIDTYLIHIFD
ncbi:MAG: M15 family metallopeptidase [Candidatus Pacebacteria bacterium]|nr:M15 family metallopeptidase [Candidatus Paceibacterota bacterium]